MKATSRLVRDNIKSLKPCVHGGEVWEAASKIGLRKEEILDFSSSVNPLGPSKKALESIKANLGHIPSYPDSNSTELREAIATQFRGIGKDNVIAGNGSTELIYLFVETFMKKGDVALIPEPTFGEYERAVRRIGEEPKHVKPNPNFQFSPAVFARDLSGAKIVFFCNPNNPTSVLTPPEHLTAIVERALEENAFVFLDEDFLEFVDGEERFSLIGKIRRYPNLFVLRSFTKIFGLTGLRVGYGIASEEIINVLLNAKIPWNVNCLAQAAATAALADKEHLKKTRQLIKDEKAFLMRGLMQIKAFKVFPADANFVFVDVRQSGYTAAELKEKMLREGVLIRDCSSFRGLDEYYIRVAVKTRRENETLLETLKKIVGNDVEASFIT
ncbi:threonine-phosphate decarboxylase [Candidatus Bathyarchaeota archaeon]|nr:threonine-phosphate decarboxylase [Candidatus Bathyarchaeota archaeon]